MSKKLEEPPKMITDNHMHLDRKGLYLHAVKQFKRAGGTRIILVHKPSFPHNVEGFSTSFDNTIKMSEEVCSLGVHSYPVIGVHPAEFDRLFNKQKEEVCYRALDSIETYIEEKKAVGMGEFGRPHYPVSERTMQAAHNYMIEALKRAKDLRCPLQLHTESLDDEGITELDTIIKELGCTKVIKHFASPSQCYTWMTPSILATESNIEKAISFGIQFFMETDYIDDLKRPGAVLGPKTVPRTVGKLQERGILTEEKMCEIEESICTFYDLCSAE